MWINLCAFVILLRQTEIRFEVQIKHLGWDMRRVFFYMWIMFDLFWHFIWFAMTVLVVTYCTVISHYMEGGGEEKLNSCHLHWLCNTLSDGQSNQLWSSWQHWTTTAKTKIPGGGGAQCQNGWQSQLQTIITLQSCERMRVMRQTLLRYKDICMVSMRDFSIHHVDWGKLVTDCPSLIETLSSVLMRQCGSNYNRTDISNKETGLWNTDTAYCFCGQVRWSNTVTPAFWKFTLGHFTFTKDLH